MMAANINTSRVAYMDVDDDEDDYRYRQNRSPPSHDYFARNPARAREEDRTVAAHKGPKRVHNPFKSPQPPIPVDARPPYPSTLWEHQPSSSIVPQPKRMGDGEPAYHDPPRSVNTPREADKSPLQVAHDNVRKRVLFQTQQYPPSLRDYVHPVLTNERALKRVVTNFVHLDTSPKFLSMSAAEFIRNLQSVPDEDVSAHMAQPIPVTMQETNGTFNKMPFNGIFGDNKKDNSNNTGYSSNRNNGHYHNYDDEWGVTYEDSDAFDDIEDWADATSYALQPAALAPATDDGTPGAAAAAGFMAWLGFRPHALSRDPDIVNDRRKSMMAIAKTVQVGIPTPVGTFTVQGLFGLLAAVLRRQDWRAYYQASSRIILIPQEISAAALDEYRLEQREQRVLGTTKYLATGCRPMMTCLTFSDGDYGSITLFDMEMRRGSEGALSSWPAAIRPHAVLPHVPKKLLKKIANDMPRSKKTELCIKSKKDRMVWSIAATSNGSSKAGPAYSPDIEQNALSEMLAGALPLESSELTGDQSANCVVATIPAMIAWLHARNVYLANIKIESTRLLDHLSTGDEEAMAVATAATTKGKGKAKATSARTASIATFVQGPDVIDHKGKNPTVIVIHPDKGDWVTTPVHWV